MYVEQYRVSGVSNTLLFLSETGHALTENGIESLFSRLRERVGMTKEDIGPSAPVKRFLQASNEGTKDGTRKEQSHGHR